IASVQSLSGTGALRIGGAFLSRFYKPSKRIYLPNPTWGNHIPIFKDSMLDVHRYRYFDKSTNGLDLKGMLSDLKEAPTQSIVLLHACAHNPTGVDPTKEEWKQICDAVQEKKHFIFFDMAYQGFASGDTDQDAFALRYFVDRMKGNLCVAQSFAKNMGLYGERVGTFSMLAQDSMESDRLLSQLKILIRPMYSNPPIHGARLASTILKTPALYSEWRSEVHDMASRIISMRKQLHGLLKSQSKLNWDHIISQIGMFCYTGITPEEVDRIQKEFSVYLTKDGRISIAGISPDNVEHLALAMHEVTKHRAK
ncbi:aspartate transaminase aat1, partial [Coelomomyces lativittatus]